MDDRPIKPPEIDMDDIKILEIISISYRLTSSQYTRREYIDIESCL